MKRLSLLLSGLLLLSLSLRAELTLETAGERKTLALPAYADMSGITWKGGDEFYVVRDGGNTVSNACVLHVMQVSLDARGALAATPRMSKGVPLVGACDAEGIAYDPGTGRVWIADESGARIDEYDPETGLRTGRRVPIPAFVVEGVRGNLSLESLTISGDGLTLWTANEEALTCDGPSARPHCSTMIRLMRFRRAGLSANWESAGMWAYACDPVKNREPAYSGVSDLAALPDGSLLVLERECSYTTLGRTRIYRPDFTGATDVSGLAALTNAAFTAVRKGRDLLQLKDGKSNGDGFLRSRVASYEGLSLGPRNPDGSVNVMLVADGGVTLRRGVSFASVSVTSEPYVRALKLRGLDLCTLAFDAPDRGAASVTGRLFRFVRGARVSVGYAWADHPGLGAAWSLAAHGLSGDGTNAAFTVERDDTLRWLAPAVRRARDFGEVGIWAETRPDWTLSALLGPRWLDAVSTAFSGKLPPVDPGRLPGLPSRKVRVKDARLILSF